MIDDSMQHNLPIPSNSDNPASVSPQQNDPNIQKPSSNPNDTKNNQNDSNSEEEENSNVIDNYDYENYDEDDNKKKEISAIEEEKNENLPEKTIFSKLAEDMYDKIVKDRNANDNFNYEAFINDQYLAMYSNKINGNNDEIIQNFIERIDEYNKLKKESEKTKEDRVIQVTDNEDNLYKEFNRRIYTEEEIEKFTEDQKRFLERKNKKIEELRKKQMESITKEIRDRPQILKYKPKKITNKSKINNMHKKNKSMCLFNTKEKKEKKMTKKEIDNLVTKLSNEKKQKRMKESKSCQQFKTNISLTSQSSNKIIFNTLLTQLKSEIENVLSTKIETEPLIVEDNFFLIMVNLSFPDDSFLDNAWNFLLSLSQSNDNIKTSILTVFILCLYNLYTESFFPYIKEKLFWIKFDNTFPISFTIGRKIHNDYRDLYTNRNINLQNRKSYKAISTYSNSESNNSGTLTKKNKIRISKQELRLKPSESYNILLRQRENKIQKIKTEQQKKIESECTFHPNKSAQFRSPSYNNVSKRLYLTKSKQKQMNINKKNVGEYNFKPVLTEFNPRIFSSEPIEEDYNVKKQIVRYSKAREEKQKRERVSSLQRKEEKGMRFDNEVKKGKESFDKFNKRIPIKKKKIKEPLLTFEIKIRNKVEILNYFEGEDIEEVANLFVKKNNLSSESRKQIINAIVDKLNKN